MRERQRVVNKVLFLMLGARWAACERGGSCDRLLRPAAAAPATGRKEYSKGSKGWEQGSKVVQQVSLHVCQQHDGAPVEGVALVVARCNQLLQHLQQTPEQIKRSKGWEQGSKVVQQVSLHICQKHDGTPVGSTCNRHRGSKGWDQGSKR